MAHSSIAPNDAPLRDLRPRNLSDVDFDLSMANVVLLDSRYVISYQWLMVTYGLSKPLYER